MWITYAMHWLWARSYYAKVCRSVFANRAYTPVLPLSVSAPVSAACATGARRQGQQEHTDRRHGARLQRRMHYIRLLRSAKINGQRYATLRISEPFASKRWHPCKAKGSARQRKWKADGVVWSYQTFLWKTLLITQPITHRLWTAAENTASCCGYSRRYYGLINKFSTFRWKK